MTTVSLITGASSGFGMLTAVELARKGHRVFATLRDLQRAGRLDAACAEAGVTVEKLALDVTRAESIDAAVAEVVRRAGRLDVLVNNAGYGLGGFFEDLAMDELRAQFETNFFGLAACIQAVLPHLRAQRSGRIINVSSISGRLAPPGVSAYAASKFAVEGLSESLRHELAPVGIHVVLIEPGTYHTDIFERNRRMARRADDPASPNHDRTRRLLAFVEDRVARSTADPRDVARAIAYAATCARPRLRYVVGGGARLQAALKRALPFRVVEAAVARILEG